MNSTCFVCEGMASSARNGDLKLPDQPWKRVSQLLSDISVRDFSIFLYSTKLERDQLMEVCNQSSPAPRSPRGDSPEPVEMW